MLVSEPVLLSESHWSPKAPLVKLVSADAGFIEIA